MRTAKMISALVPLLMPWAVQAQEQPELVVRNPHYFVIVGDGERAPTVSVQVRSFFDKTQGLKLEVSDPAGSIRLNTTVMVGEQATRRIPGEPAELYLASANMDSNGIVFSCDRPWAVYAAGRTGLGSNGAVPEMYLYVPEETEAFTVRVSAVSPNEGGRVTLHHPDGSVALVMDGEFDTEEERQVEVPEALRGRAWSLTWAEPQTADASLQDINVYIEGPLTPLLWIEREWAEAHGEMLWERHRAALAEEGAQ
ncbi:MAG: hypothetical protein U9R79_04165 [Armatimonadota bacterium]|nr:hypothetical protein [Armatimonadota bacterium]